MKGQLVDAERYYRNALRLDPNNATATQNLAVLFAQNGNVNEALLTIERAAMFDGVMPVIHTNRAFMCLESDRIDEALASAELAVQIAPTNPKDEIEKNSYLGARLALAMVSATAGLPAKSITAYREMLKVAPDHPMANPNVCFVQSLTFSTPKDLLEQRQVWYNAFRYVGPKKAHHNDKNPNRPLRVGYVGGDFKTHSAAMMFSNVIWNHDPSKIEVFLYSSLPVDPVADPYTKQFCEVAGCKIASVPKSPFPTDGSYEKNPHPSDRWRDISAMNDDDAEHLVRADKIDILVDLAGHTNGGRLALFTRKPAPVQVTAWGFAHGTGLPEIDYFFADPIAIREEERQYYAEKIFDLPCIVTYNPPTNYNLKATSMSPYYKNEYITFGSYSRYEKLSDECLATFAEILRRVPDSKIEWKDHAFKRPYAIRRIRNAMPDIDPKRLLFSISTSHPDHMLAHQMCDIALDPYYHGGGIVCLEQLYMGVPLLTMYGPQPSGRTASSVLASIGRTDWIARSPEEYVEKAVEWSGRHQDLSKARRTLREELLNSPVVKGYREAVEDAYRSIWQTYCEK